MVWNIFYLHPYLGKWSNLTNIFQRGWNHQLESGIHAFMRISPCQGLPVPEDEAATKGGFEPLVNIFRFTSSWESKVSQPNLPKTHGISLKWIMNQHVFLIFFVTLKLAGYSWAIFLFCLNRRAFGMAWRPGAPLVRRKNWQRPRQKLRNARISRL